MGTKRKRQILIRRFNNGYNWSFVVGTAFVMGTTSNHQRKSAVAQARRWCDAHLSDSLDTKYEVVDDD